MPRRRQSVAPLNQIDVLKSQIAALEKRIKILEAPKMSSMQTVSNPVNLNDPQQGMLMVNAEGTHETATTTDPIQYYHDGAMRKIPGGSTPAWVSLYDDITIGQLVFDVGTNFALKFPGSTMSENGAGYFSVTSAFDTEMDADIYTVELLQDGLYAITLDVQWSDPSKAEMDTKYYIDSTPVGDLKFPGELTGFFNGIFATVNHRTENYTDWETWDNVSWVLPLKVSGGAILDPRIVLQHKNPTSGSDATNLGAKKLHIAWLGPLLHDIAFP